MTGYEMESYDNGSRFARSIATNYGVPTACTEVLSDVRALELSGPSLAWVCGALDVCIGLALDAKATDMLRRENDAALLAATRVQG